MTHKNDSAMTMTTTTPSRISAAASRHLSCLVVSFCKAGARTEQQVTATEFAKLTSEDSLPVIDCHAALALMKIADTLFLKESDLDSFRARCLKSITENLHELDARPRGELMTYLRNLKCGVDSTSSSINDDDDDDDDDDISCKQSLTTPSLGSSGSWDEQQQQLDDSSTPTTDAGRVETKIRQQEVPAILMVNPRNNIQALKRAHQQAMEERYVVFGEQQIRKKMKC